MITEKIESLSVSAYRKGLNDFIMLIERGLGKGLTLEQSYYSAKKAIEKTFEEENET